MSGGPVANGPALTPESSAALAALSAVALGLVAAIHATNFGPGCETGAAGASGAVAAVEAFVAFGVGRVAVPYFFAASGLLFFHRISGRGDVRAKLRRRVGSLLVPYLAWSGLILLAYALALRTPLAPLARQMNGPDPHAGPAAWLRSWLLVPAAGHFWFVRDLFVLALFTPLLWPLLSRLGRWRWTVPAAAWVAWAVLPDPVVISSRPPWGVASLVALASFTTGACLAPFADRLDRLRVVGAPLGIAAAVWVGLCAVRLYGPGWSPAANLLLDRGAIAVGLVVFWSLGPSAVRLVRAVRAGAVERHAFFCYAAHFPAVVVLSKGGTRLVGGAPAGHLAAFLLAPVLTLAAAAVAAEVLARYAPPVLRLLSGGRVARIVPRPAPAP